MNGKVWVSKFSPSLIKMLEFTLKQHLKSSPKTWLWLLHHSSAPRACQESLWGLLLAVGSDSITEQGQQKLRAELTLRNKRNLHPSLSWSGVMDTCTSSALGLCLWLTWTPVTGGSSALPHSGARILVGRGKYTHSKGAKPAQADLRLLFLAC